MVLVTKSVIMFYISGGITPFLTSSSFQVPPHNVAIKIRRGHKDNHGKKQELPA